MYGSLRAWASADTAQPDAVPVCRFYWPSQVLHFYTAFAFECDKLIKSPGPWILENAAAFYVLLPEAATGACPADSAPIYRLQVSSDHLFISSLADRNRILATGQEITPEGFGPLGVAFCSPVD